MPDECEIRAGTYQTPQTTDGWSDFEQAAVAAFLPIEMGDVTGRHFFWLRHSQRPLLIFQPLSPLSPRLGRRDWEEQATRYAASQSSRRALFGI